MFYRDQIIQRSVLRLCIRKAQPIRGRVRDGSLVMHFKSDPSDFVFVVMRWGWRINFEMLLKLQKREDNDKMDPVVDQDN